MLPFKNLHQFYFNSNYKLAVYPGTSEANFFMVYYSLLGYQLHIIDIKILYSLAMILYYKKYGWKESYLIMIRTQNQKNQLDKTI